MTRDGPRIDKALLHRYRAGFWTWICYHWPMVLVHLALLTLGLVNLYPFIWMLGTSFKSEQEASIEKLRPVPGPKYKLAEGFDLETVVPAALEPDLAAAEGEARLDALNLVRRKLEVLHDLQRRAWAERVEHEVSLVVGPLDDEIVRLKAEADRLARVWDAKREAARRGEVPWPEVDAFEARLDAARRAYETARDAATGAAVRGLLERGVLVEDPVHDSLWFSEAGFARTWPKALTPRQRAASEALWDHFTLGPIRYANTVAVELETARRQMAEWATIAGGILVPVGEADEGETVYRLAEGGRGRIYRDLYPRQILALWLMHAENTRRAESRNTFATDRWSPEDYGKYFGLADVEQARAELREAVEAGYLADGTAQPINYWVVLKEENFLLHFLTSLLITSVVVVASILLSSMLGYALARGSFPGKMLVLGVLIAASILPTEARIIPIFKMLLAVGALENLWGMVAWLSSAGVGQTLLMAGFFLTLPKEVDEAAEVDGAGIFRKFFDIALPMARPIVMTVGLFAFLGAWNNFLVPLLCTISRPSMQPLAVAVYSFQQGHPGKWHQINAAAAVMIIPVIVMFLFVQKHVVKAIAVGAVKG